MQSSPTERYLLGVLPRKPNEQAPELARRLFGLPLGADDESADVLRYYFEHQLGFVGGIVPNAVTELDLPSVPELFRLFRARGLGDRPTGRWTKQARAKKPTPGKPRL